MQKKNNFPSNIKTTKSKIAYWVFRQLYTRSVGQGQVIGRFSNMIPEIGVAILVIEKFTPVNLTIWTFVYAFIGIFIVAWLIGRFWMKWSLDMIDAQVSGERNMLQNEIHQKIVKEKERREI